MELKICLKNDGNITFELDMAAGANPEQVAKIFQALTTGNLNNTMHDVVKNFAGRTGKQTLAASVLSAWARHQTGNGPLVKPRNCLKPYL